MLDHGAKHLAATARIGVGAGTGVLKPQPEEELVVTSLSSALRASDAPTGRVIVRHSPLVRICHWVNAGCFVVLLMSGLQIFNADPALTWGQATNFAHPFFSLSARENDDGDPTAGVTTIFGRPFNTTGLLGASRGDDGTSWLSIG